MRSTLLFIAGGIIIINVVMAQFFPQEVAKMPDGFSTPIIAYEFLQTPEEVVQFFGSDTTKREEWITGMDNGHKVDYIYLLFYSAFLGLWGWIAAKRTGNNLFYMIPILAIIAGIADLFENLQLMELTQLLEGGAMEGTLHKLFVFTWIKWGCLALGLAGLSIYLYPRNWGGKTYSLISLITLVLAVLAFVERSVITTYFTLGIVLLFTLLIVIAVFDKKATSVSPS